MVHSLINGDSRGMQNMYKVYGGSINTVYSMSCSAIFEITSYVTLLSLWKTISLNDY